MLLLDFLLKQTTPIIYQHNLFQELYLLAKAITAQDVLHGLGITMFWCLNVPISHGFG